MSSKRRHVKKIFQPSQELEFGTYLEDLLAMPRTSALEAKEKTEKFGFKLIMNNGFVQRLVFKV